METTMTDQPDRPHQVSNDQLDVISWILGSADDPPGVARALAAVAPDEIHRLLISAVTMGGELVKVGDFVAAVDDEMRSPRQLLEAMRTAIRSGDAP
jgi:hypothetical protein